MESNAKDAVKKKERSVSDHSALRIARKTTVQSESSKSNIAKNTSAAYTKDELQGIFSGIVQKGVVHMTLTFFCEVMLTHFINIGLIRNLHCRGTLE